MDDRTLAIFITILENWIKLASISFYLDENQNCLASSFQEKIDEK